LPAASGIEAPSPYAGIRLARTVEEAKAALPARKAATIQSFAQAQLPAWPGRNEGHTARSGSSRVRIPQLADAKLALGRDVDRVNAVLLQAAPYSGVGTHFELLPGIGRQGDYDFTLINATALAHRHWNSPHLRPETRRHLARTVLNQEGANHIPEKWLGGLIPETENHILMTETARYLKNQLVAQNGLEFSTHHLSAREYDNATNGFDTWFAERLARFVREDFDEYNSRPYQGWSVRAIQTLYEFAHSSQVKTAAHIVLDYLSVRFALQSSDLRRSVPFRRRMDYAGRDNLQDGDPEASRFAVLAGNYAGHERTGDGPSALGTNHALSAALSTYQIPDAILGLAIDKAASPYTARFRHRNTEIVHAEARFLISAGGHAQRWSDLPFSGQEDGIARPTVVMVAGQGPSQSRMIRFLGRGDGKPANNTGVFENFACGSRPIVPDALLARARRAGQYYQDGPFEFLAADGVMVALHRQARPTPSRYADAVGFLEIVDAREFANLEAFAQRVRKANAGREFGYFGPNRYTTSRGTTVAFVMADPPGSRPDTRNWLIRGAWDQDGHRVALETRLSAWPLADVRSARGEPIMRADGTGQILVQNPATGKSLLLSLADPRFPIRVEQDGPLVDVAASADLRAGTGPGRTSWDLAFGRPEPVRFLSARWAAGSTPREVRVYVRDALPDAAWRLVQRRDQPAASASRPFRTDFDLGPGDPVAGVRIEVDGDVRLDGRPEAYRGI
jgi:hypothetical protein